MLPLLLAGAALAQDAATMDVMVGGAVVVPTGRSGAAQIAQVGVSTALSRHHHLGLRLGVAPPGAATTHTIWAPAVDYRGFFRLDGPMDPFFTAQLGFLLADRSSEGRTNLAEAAGALGLGFELGWPMGARRVFLAPSVGLAPGAFFGDGPFSVAAPIADLRIGLRTPPSTR
jgi:hypothetical protein